MVVVAKVVSFPRTTYFESDPVFLNVNVGKPTIMSKPTSIVQATTRTVAVRYGNYNTAGTARLQYKNSAGTWVNVKSVGLAHGSASITWTASATHTYRVAITPAGKSAAYTPTFAVTYLPRLAVSAPKSVKKNSTVTFTVTKYYVSNLSANLQRWNGSKWVTVKTFGVGGVGQIVKAKVTSTSKWRITTGTYSSAAVTVKTY